MKPMTFLSRPAISTGLATILCASLLAFTPTGLEAQGLKSANERINFSGKLRMLSQRMAAAGCNLNAGVDAPANSKRLTAAQAEFKKILAGLQNGSGDLKIDGAESNDAILDRIADLGETWAPIDAAITTLTQDPFSSESMELINAQNMALLAAAQDVVSAVVTVYADNGADAALGKAIDVAGRQRMLTQKMSKEACQIASGDSSAERSDSLKGTINLFDSSLADLSTGENGMARPPSRDVSEGLADVAALWTDLKPALEAAATGVPMDTDQRAKLAADLNVALQEANRVVGFYVIARQETGNIEDIGATERINFSGKLRMLSQRVAAAACNYTAGINRDESLAILTAAQTEFDKITNGLEFGDPDLRMRGQEKRRKTLVALEALKTEWNDVSAAIDGLVQGKDVETSISLIDGHNLEVLERAKLLVSELSGQYSDPTAMLQADAMLVDISGRQRMLTQKMSKEACQVWSGNTDAAEALKGTMQMFEISLLALREGMSEAGIKPAPTEDIRAGLDDIWGDWMELKPSLEVAVAKQNPPAELRSDVFADLNTMLREMNAVVGLYTIYGKTGL